MFNFQPPVLDVDVPSASLLLTMGKHTGPALTAEAAVGAIAYAVARGDKSRVKDLVRTDFSGLVI